MTNSINTPIAADELEPRLAALLDTMPDAITSHIDYLTDDFHDALLDYLRASPRINAMIELDPTLDFDADRFMQYDAFAATIDRLAITDTDLLAIIAMQFYIHDCDDEQCAATYDYDIDPD